MNRHTDRGLATRRHILDTATRLFTEHGYEAVSIETILTACAISRGALYHHFQGKEGVFTAVLEEAETRIVERLTEAAKAATDPVEALRAGCAAWLAMAAADPVVRRIVLIDAPGVIGWHAWRALDARYTLGLIRAALSRAAEAGRIAPERVELATHMLLAVLVEVALMIARDTGGIPVAEGQAAVDGLIGGLVTARRVRGRG
jgi:AcrR family transcriptional regulator